MAKVTALGIFHTPMGRFLKFSCGCGEESVREHDRKHEHYATSSNVVEGKVMKPVWCTFECDYVFEARPIEVELGD
jgi:hypothetical protein